MYVGNLKEKTNQKINQNLLYFNKVTKELKENKNSNSIIRTNILKTEGLKQSFQKIQILNITESQLKESFKTLSDIYIQSSLESIDAKGKILKLHFEAQQDQTNTREHYDVLLNDLENLKENISSLDNQETVLPKLKVILKESQKLTKQSDYTLFTMRAVEIGLPLLLCLISFLLALKYPLTEEKIQEIKEALDQRTQL